MSHYRKPRTNETPSCPLTILKHVAIRDRVKVSLQASIMHGFPITLSLEWPTEANVLPNCGILQKKNQFVELR
jgi:hypothetical protein